MPKEFEVEDPVALAKLNGIALAIHKLDAKATRLRAAVFPKTEVATAMNHTRDLILGLCEGVHKDVDAGNLTGDEAKLKIAGITAAAEIVRQAGLDASKAALQAKQQADGVAAASNEITKEWTATAAKYERQERVEREEREAKEAADTKAPKGKKTKKK